MQERASSERERQVKAMWLKFLWIQVVLMLLSGLVAAWMALSVFNEKTCPPPIGGWDAVPAHTSTASDS